METNALLEKFQQLPAPLKKEVEDFVDFLILKSEGRSGFFTGWATVADISTETDLLSKKETQEKIKLPKPVFGSGKGIFGKIADDFDDPLDDMKEYM